MSRPLYPKYLTKDNIFNYEENWDYLGIDSTGEFDSYPAPTFITESNYFVMPIVFVYDGNSGTDTAFNIYRITKQRLTTAIGSNDGLVMVYIIYAYEGEDNLMHYDVVSASPIKTVCLRNNL